MLVKSEALEAIKPKLQKAADYILKCIADGRPIYIRHHNDCDGYTSGFALERALRKLIIDKKSARYVDRYLRVSPSRTPYYSYGDAAMDLGHALSNRDQHDRLLPLIINMDNGSSEEDILALKKAKLHGAKLMVIDHHHFSEEVDEIVDVHVNPMQHGFSGILSTGMMAVELAHMVNPNVEHVIHLAAISGIGDFCLGEEFDQYLALSKGFDREYLEHVSGALNWEAFHANHNWTRALIDVLLGKRTKEQEAMVALCHEHMHARRQEIKASIEKYAQQEQQENALILRLDLDNLTFRGDYYSAGKIASLTFHHFTELHPEKKILVMGIGPNFVSFRATRELTLSTGELFDVNGFVHDFREKYPHARVQGGGHAVAGTIRFLGAGKEEVFADLEGQVKNLK